ncbi:MAG TPA: cupin domain-containing protein [Rhabdochlamydiaceae bacterium]|nr:cupin domain-containing protein [Rhabdochlamydiaceae bacterium]
MIKKVNIKQKLSLFSDYWNPRVIGELNGQQVRIAKFQGEFTWHHHEKEDELFLVIKGRLLMKLRDQEIWLEEGEMIIIPAGVEHLPVAPEEAHILLFEPAATKNTGNVKEERTRKNLKHL